MEITIINPKSDDKLTWNEETGRYELSFQFIRKEYDNTNFKDDKTLKRRLTKNSRNIYNYIYYRSNSNNKIVVDFFLNRTQQGRDFLFAALSSQFEADNESGYNDIGDVAPINVANGQIIDRNQIWSNLVSVNTEQIIDNNSRYLGVNILYQAPLPWLYFKIARENL